MVDAATEAAVPATIEMFDVTGRVSASIAADSEGWFRLEDLAPGPCTMEAVAEGYVSARLAVEVSDEARLHEIELQSGQPGRVDVALRRDDGTGVAGIPVTIYDPQGMVVQSQPTFSSGSRSFEDLPAGEYFVAWTEPLSGAGTTSRFEVAPLHPQVFEPALTPGASVLLTCPAHRCADAAVELLTVHSRGGLELSPLLSGVSAALRFSADGDLSLGRLAPGRYLFRLWVDGERWQREVTIGDGEARVSFN